MKIFEGNIISVGMNKTVVVEVFRRTPHPLYRKLIKLSSKFKVDNTGFENLEVGATVRIGETRPISKHKHFKILSVVGAKAESKVKTEKVQKETVRSTGSEQVESKVEVEKPKKAVKKTAVKKAVEKESPSRVNK